MKKALVVLSGGQDSTTCLFWAKQQFNQVHAISFDYGQRHSIELEAAKKVAEMAKVLSHEIVNLQNCLVSTSPLTSQNKLEQYSDFNQMDGVIGDRVELTFVPMRNMLFLTIAMNRAVALGCTAVVTGICQADNANYPDCTEGFRHYFEVVANAALGLNGKTRPFIHAVAPFIRKSKRDMVLRARELPGCWEALAYTHTSYDGKYPPIDKNHANILRAHGFEEADLPDPLVMRAVEEGLMEYPNTPNYAPEKVASNQYRQSLLWGFQNVD